MSITEQIIERAEILQVECHKYVDSVGKIDKVQSCQDVTNVWIFCKIAEMEIKIYELSKIKQHVY